MRPAAPGSSLFIDTGLDAWRPYLYRTDPCLVGAVRMRTRLCLMPASALLISRLSQQVVGATHGQCACVVEIPQARQKRSEARIADRVLGVIA